MEEAAKVVGNHPVKQWCCYLKTDIGVAEPIIVDEYVVLAMYVNRDTCCPSNAGGSNCSIAGQFRQILIQMCSRKLNITNISINLPFSMFCFRTPQCTRLARNPDYQHVTQSLLLHYF